MKYLTKYTVVKILVWFSWLDPNLATGPIKWIVSSPVTVSYTGSCPIVAVSSLYSCSMECFRREYCMFFVYSQCGLLNCQCVLCHIAPTSSPGGDQLVGVLKMPGSNIGKRLVDDQFCTSSGTVTSWRDVSSGCVNAAEDITMTFSPKLVTSFRLSSVQQETNQIKYHIEPVCAPTFVKRGSIHCTSTGGVWVTPNNLACLPGACYQRHQGRHAYAGTHNKDRKGRTCWTWNVWAPFSNNFMNDPYDFDYGNIAKAKNYCRSWSYDASGVLWCYNGEYQVGVDEERWDRCDIPVCEAVY